MAPTTVLITGANRGIGAALVSLYLARPSTIVIATVREINEANKSKLHSLNQAKGSRLILVPFNLDLPSSAADDIFHLQDRYGVPSLDIVIANAGICNTWSPVDKLSDNEVLIHFQVNALGLLRLFKAVLPLLQAAQQPKIAYMSTMLASIQDIPHDPSLTAAYGMSKVAGNYLIEKINAEFDDITAFPISPGFVKTDMGNRGAKLVGLEQATMSVNESASQIIDQIEKASKTNTNGRFINYNGETLPW
ncbi:hypothetical protein TRIATDRAFT_309969 [Trichoderma atroviride IMI 206040]|uniref:Uncharacterized protein n=1 Tax=Hypocrea atroviridis (strain ATCC 20476 / IMI 206040) TaxID=452589 RepID=G9P0K6_HYPAI|nr:uncharacterized protein TRIATDRAFT_309969 [Trichoderma atroviride IMI 206040]EHK42377.1 hypothetical protein TRIATDRAFT_309969 [Trichoderma atroviride IMI 206040]